MYVNTLKNNFNPVNDIKMINDFNRISNVKLVNNVGLVNNVKLADDIKLICNVKVLANNIYFIACKAEYIMEMLHNNLLKTNAWRENKCLKKLYLFA